MPRYGLTRNRHTFGIQPSPSLGKRAACQQYATAYVNSRNLN
eukprot:SAG31_NODE_2025_length_6642_cov_6.408681_2_plen_42_part_00